MRNTTVKSIVNIPSRCMFGNGSIIILEQNISVPSMEKITISRMVIIFFFALPVIYFVYSSEYSAFSSISVVSTPEVAYSPST